jgi:hypothetical protein
MGHASLGATESDLLRMQLKFTVCRRSGVVGGCIWDALIRQYEDGKFRVQVVNVYVGGGKLESPKGVANPLADTLEQASQHAAQIAAEICAEEAGKG